MKEAEVILARSAGFCFGVHRAVDTVYERTGMENVYTYGPIIHNDEVVKDLESKGVKTISGTINANNILKVHKRKTIIICNRVEKAQKLYNDLLQDLKGFQNLQDLNETNIICLHSRFFDEDRKKALKCGMDGFLSKPIVIEELISTLQKNLDQVSGV
jgi:CRISPR/Cas system-associated endonuclease/helicase Cas3